MSAASQRCVQGTATIRASNAELTRLRGSRCHFVRPVDRESRDIRIEVDCIPGGSRSASFVTQALQAVFQDAREKIRSERRWPDCLSERARREKRCIEQAAVSTFELNELRHK